MIEENRENWFEKRIVWQFTVTAMVIGAVLAIFVPIWQIKTEVALQNQKLDQLISWSQKHNDDTSTFKNELNLTFSDIYEKLGEKYLRK